MKSLRIGIIQGQVVRGWRRICDWTSSRCVRDVVEEVNGCYMNNAMIKLGSQG
jgi:hypothetical protein